MQPLKPLAPQQAFHLDLMPRRQALRVAAWGLSSLILPAAFAAKQTVPARGQGTMAKLTVWKDPNCGCCKDWIKHIEHNGFQVQIKDSGNAAARAALGMAQKYASCHTAQVQTLDGKPGYVIEGHVPAADIIRLLRTAPQALGLAVPGMPIGSPGMDGPAYGGRKDPYHVLLVQRDASATVFQTY